MYRLKKDLDLSFLENLELIQVCVGIFQVQFVFESDVVLSVENTFKHSSNGTVSEWRPNVVEAATSVLKLLGTTSKTIEAVNEQTLRLGFSNGDTLEMTDDSDQYESFTITAPGKTIVV